MRVFKRVLAVVLGVLVLASVALAVFIATFDANRYKPQIEALASQQLGRSLKLEGDVRLSLWPILGLRAEQVSVGNLEGFSDPQFATAEALVLGVRLGPLLGKRLEVEELAVDGLHLYLERRADGSNNWQLAPPAPKEAAAAPAKGEAGRGFGLLIGGLRLDQAAIQLRDGKSGKLWRIQPVDLETGAIAPGQPFDASLTAGFAEADGKLTGQLRYQGRMRIDPQGPGIEISELSLDGDAANLPGDIGKLVFKARSGHVNVTGESLALSATQLTLDLQVQNGPAPLELLDAKLNVGLAGELSPLRLNISSLEGKLGAEGPGLGSKGLHVGLAGAAALDWAAGTGRIERLSLDADGLRATLSGTLEGLSAKPRFAGHMEVAAFDPRAWLAAHGHPLAFMPKDVLTQASVKGELRYAPGSLALTKLEGGLDETHAEGSLTLDKAGWRADLALDRLNVDRYLPPGPKAAAEPSKAGGGSPPPGPGADTPIDLPVAMLRKLNGELNLRVEGLTVRHVDVQGLHLAGKARGGEITIDTLAGGAFDGKIEARGGLDVRGASPAYRAAGKLTAVDVGAILRQFAGSDRLRGHGTVDFDLHSAGTSVNALKAGLGGTARARLYDGAIQGVNVTQLVRLAYAAIQRQPPPPPAPQETVFTEITGSATIAKGVVRNPDLAGLAPPLRLQGEGSIDLPRNGIDYRLTVIVDPTLGAPLGLEGLGGLPIPLRVSGALSDPSFQVDLGKVLEERAKQEVKKRVTEELQKRLGLPAPAEEEEAPAPLQNLLKGLLGR